MTIWHVILPNVYRQCCSGPALACMREVCTSVLSFTLLLVRGGAFEHCFQLGHNRIHGRFLLIQPA